MKKGLLSILAGALLVVGCQNYDDQFDALETQINALASTVAGLSQVQSDLSSLSGTVASLASTVNGLGSQIDTAVSDGLSDIQADVDAITAAVADVASAEEVASLSTAIADANTDLDELLANSSVFTGNITINSAATLAAFKAMGSSIAIVNGNVDIDVSTTMNQADVQTVVDQILTVTGNFDYTAGASTIAETTFNNLSGVQSLTLKQGGGYHLKSLVSATGIVLDDTWKSTVTIVDLRALTSVTSLNNEGQANGYLKFDKATEMHLTSLALFGTGGLDLQVKKGGVIDITALDDLNSAGTAVGSSYALSIDGPSSAGNANIGDGVLTFTNVASVNVSGFIGDTTIGAGVENLTVDGAVALDISAAADLVTANITGALDSDATLTTADTAGPAITFASTDLTSATVAGIVGAINATTQSNLETLTISADLKGAALTVDDNDDLTSLVVTGAKLADITINGNGDLESATMDHTTSLASTDKGATVAVTANTNMTSFTFSADDVDTLTVTGNTQLATINFTGLKDWGTATAATVTVSGNALVASAFKDNYDATTTTDTGAFTTASGMETLKTYLTAVITSNTSVLGVYFDTVESLTEQLTSATTAFTDVSGHVDAVSGNVRNAYAYQTAFVADTTPTVRETKTHVIGWDTNSLFAASDMAATEGIRLTYGGVVKNYVAPTGGQTAAAYIAAINADTTFGSGITVTAALDANRRSIQNVTYNTAAGVGETVPAGGSLGWQFGTVTGTITVATTDYATDMAGDLATAISGTNVSGVTYHATASGTAVVFAALITNVADAVDQGPSTITFPTLSFRVSNLTDTTVDLATGANTSIAGLSSDYFLSVSESVVNDFRITIKNNSTSVALSYTLTDVASQSANGLASSGVGLAVALVSGTTTSPNAAYASAFADISTPGSGTAAVTKNRLSWL